MIFGHEVIAYVGFSNPIVMPTPTSPDPEIEVKEIDTYCDSLFQTSLENKEPSLVVADVSDMSEGEKPRWQKFASVEEHEKFRENVNETYFISYNWEKNSKIVVTTFTIFSPSGDWSKFVDSCYREDGSLARAKIVFSTFYGDFRMKNSIYFNQSGKVLSDEKEYVNFDNEPMAVDKSSISDNPALLDKDYFKKVSLLPYYKSIKK